MIRMRMICSPLQTLHEEIPDYIHVVDILDENQFSRTEITKMMINAKTVASRSLILKVLSVFCVKHQSIFVNIVNANDCPTRQTPNNGPNEQNFTLFVLDWIFKRLNNINAPDIYFHIISSVLRILHSYDAVFYIHVIKNIINLLKMSLRHFTAIIDNDTPVNVFKFETFTIATGSSIKYQPLLFDNSERSKTLIHIANIVFDQQLLAICSICANQLKREILTLSHICIALDDDVEDKTIRNIIDISCGNLVRLTRVYDGNDRFLLAAGLENLISLSADFFTPNLLQFIRTCSRFVTEQIMEAIVEEEKIENTSVLQAFMEANMNKFVDRFNESSMQVPFIILLLNIRNGKFLKLGLMMEHKCSWNNEKLGRSAHNCLKQLLLNAARCEKSCDELFNLLFVSGINEKGTTYELKFTCRLDVCREYRSTLNLFREYILTGMEKGKPGHWKKLLLCLTLTCCRPILREDQMQKVINHILQQYEQHCLTSSLIIANLPTSYKLNKCWNVLEVKDVEILATFLFAKCEWPTSCAHDEFNQIMKDADEQSARSLICLSSTGARLCLPGEKPDFELPYSIVPDSDSYFLQGFVCKTCTDFKCRRSWINSNISSDGTNTTYICRPFIKLETVFKIISSFRYSFSLARSIRAHYEMDEIVPQCMDLWEFISHDPIFCPLSPDTLSSMIRLFDPNERANLKAVQCGTALRYMFESCKKKNLKFLVAQCADVLAQRLDKDNLTLNSLTDLMGKRAEEVAKDYSSLILASALASQAANLSILVGDDSRSTELVVQSVPELILILVSGRFEVNEWETIIDHVSKFANVPVREMLLISRQAIAKELACSLGYSDNCLISLVSSFVCRAIGMGAHDDLLLDRLACVLLQVERQFCSIQNSPSPLSIFPLVRRPNVQRDGCHHAVHKHCSLIRGLYLLMQRTGVKESFDLERYLNTIRTAVITIIKLPKFAHSKHNLLEVMRVFGRFLIESPATMIDHSIVISFAACVAEIRAINEFWPLVFKSNAESARRRYWQTLITDYPSKFEKKVRNILLPWALVKPSPSRKRATRKILRRKLPKISPLRRIRKRNALVELHSPITPSRANKKGLNVRRRRQVYSTDAIECLLETMARSDDHLLQIYLLRKMNILLTRLTKNVQNHRDLCYRITRQLILLLSYSSSLSIDTNRSRKKQFSVQKNIYPSLTIKLLIGKCLSKLSYEACVNYLRSFSETPHFAVTLSSTIHLPLMPKTFDIGADAFWIAGVCLKLSVSYMSNSNDADTKHCAAYAIQGIMYALDDHSKATVIDTLAKNDLRAKDLTESLFNGQEPKLTIESIIPPDYVEEVWRENWICGLALDLNSCAMHIHKKQFERTLLILQSIFHILSRDVHFGKFMLPALIFLASVEDVKRIALRFNEAMKRADQKGDMFMVIDAICFTCVSIRRAQMHSCTLTLTQELSEKDSLASFIHNIDKRLLVNQFVKMDAYTDALIELELYLMSTSTELLNTTDFETLQELYWKIGDSDSSVGVMKYYWKTMEQKTSLLLPSLHLMALANEAEGNSVDTVSCYERVIREEEHSMKRLKLCKRYLRTLITVDQLYTASSLADRACKFFKDTTALRNSCPTIVSSDDATFNDLFGFQVETAWRLCDWKHLKQVCHEVLGKSSIEPAKLVIKSLSINDMFELNTGLVLNEFSIAAEGGKPKTTHLNHTIVNQSELLAKYLSCSNAGIHTKSTQCLIKLQLVEEMRKDMKRQIPSPPCFQLLTELPDIASVNLWIAVKKAVASVLHARQKILLPQAFYCDLLIAQSRACRLITANQGFDRATAVNAWLCSSMKSALSAIATSLPTDSLRLAYIFLERAHWFHSTDYDSANHYQAFQAIAELERAASFAIKISDESSKVLAVIDLLKAKWMMESSLADSDSILSVMRESVKNCNRWHSLQSEAHFSLAYLLDYVIETNYEKNEHFVEMCEAYIHTISSCCSSLSRSPLRCQQCLSRLFTHYFLFAKKLCHQQSMTAKDAYTEAKYNERHRCETQITQVSNLIEELIKNENLAILNAIMMIFNQLVSRICHPNRLVYRTLNNVICKLLETFPERAVWYMVSGSQSSNNERRQRCQQLLTRASRHSTAASLIIRDCLDICSLLSELCQKKIKANTTVASSMSFKKSFPQLLARIQSCKLILPIKKQLLQMDGRIYNGSDLVYFCEFQDTIEVMKSLQKPKRVVVRGSDGEFYAFLCKARDDLRIDQRMMEFCELINRCFLQRHDSVAANLMLNNEDNNDYVVAENGDTNPLHKNHEPSPFHTSGPLYIRTYSVLPITDSCGLIEMIANVRTIRSILDKLYEKYNGLVTNRVAIRQLAAPDPRINNPAKAKYESFIKRVLSTFSPPVLHNWFASDQFESVESPIAQKWYSSKIKYCRTTAVMSIVGWMVGLGDRHCENILIDTNNGDCVHVDFNCLFNKGETFQVPELVPFRLTHNIVHAMGVLGVEGIFRKTCEKVTQLMRKHKDVLISVLETFVYDPLVEWKRNTHNPKPSSSKGNHNANLNKSTTAAADPIEILNPMAKSQIDNIRWRLSGHVGKLYDDFSSPNNNANNTQTTPLSVDGQVDLLIKQAMDNFLLAQMFIGWAPHL